MALEYQRALIFGSGDIKMAEIMELVFTADFTKELIQYSSIAIAVGMALEIGLSLLGNSLYKMFNLIERS